MAPGKWHCSSISSGESPYPVLTFSMRKLKQRECHHFLGATHLKRGAAKISKSLLVLGCNTRESGSADTCLDFFRAKPWARNRKENEIRQRLSLPSNLQHLVLSLSLTPNRWSCFSSLRKTDAPEGNLQMPAPSIPSCLKPVSHAPLLSLETTHLSCRYLLCLSFRWFLPPLLNLKGHGRGNCFLATQELHLSK